MRNAIEIHALTKRYGTLTALDEVSFEVGRGELFGLIGPDGAGKTTLFRLLATLVAPDGGTASVDGLDIVDDYKRIRERVGYMPGRFSLYPDLSVGENLAFFAALFGVEIAENYDLIAPIYRQIEPFRARRAGKLSGGMKQKLALCCALIHRPAVLLLDEPTTGVDAVSRSEFWDMLSELKGKGISMLVSTPYMDEAVRCDRVALCDGGKILAVDTPQGRRAVRRAALRACGRRYVRPAARSAPPCRREGVLPLRPDAPPDRGRGVRRRTLRPRDHRAGIPPCDAPTGRGGNRGCVHKTDAPCVNRSYPSGN